MLINVHDKQKWKIVYQPVEVRIPGILACEDAELTVLERYWKIPCSLDNLSC